MQGICSGRSRNGKRQREKMGKQDRVPCIELLILVQYTTELDYIQNSCPLLPIHFTCNNGHSINAYWVNLAFWVTEEVNKTDNFNLHDLLISFCSVSINYLDRSQQKKAEFMLPYSLEHHHGREFNAAGTFQVVPGVIVTIRKQSGPSWRLFG